MSLNTGNLRTTELGQTRLAQVMSANSEEKKERGIVLKLAFTYISISEKKVSEIEEAEFVNSESLKAVEKTLSPVDVAQVQESESGGKNFSVGALVEVQNEMSAARNIILFAGIRVIDNRTEAQKKRDGYRDAATVVYQDYRLNLPAEFAESHFAFAYSNILGATGTYNEALGVKVSTSLFGRSRYRLLFNYIVSSDSGISDQITVNDNVYPYSSGYLSKRAFEEGIKEYDEILSKYSQIIKEYTLGWNKTYPSVIAALEGSYGNNEFHFGYGHKDTFLINDGEQMLSSLPGVLPSEITSRDFEWEDFQPEDITGDASEDWLKSDNKQASQIFPVSTYRKVTYKVNGVVSVSKVVPVTMVFVMFARAGLMFDQNTQPHPSAYHGLRMFFSIPKEDSSGNVFVGCEIDRKVLYNGFLPEEPIIGSIELDRIETQGAENNVVTASLILAHLEYSDTTSIYNATYKYMYSCVEVEMSGEPGQTIDIKTPDYMYTTRYYEARVQNGTWSVVGTDNYPKISSARQYGIMLPPADEETGSEDGGDLKLTPCVRYFSPNFKVGGDVNKRPYVIIHGTNLSLMSNCPTVLDGGDIINPFHNVSAIGDSIEYEQDGQPKVKSVVGSAMVYSPDYSLFNSQTFEQGGFDSDDEFMLSCGAGDGFVYYASMNMSYANQIWLLGLSAIALKIRSRCGHRVFYMGLDDILGIHGESGAYEITNSIARLSILNVEICDREIKKVVVTFGIDFVLSSTNEQHLYTTYTKTVSLKEDDEFDVNYGVGIAACGTGNVFGQYINQANYNDSGEVLFGMCKNMDTRFGKMSAQTFPPTSKNSLAVMCAGDTASGTNTQNCARSWLGTNKYVATRNSTVVITPTLP